ncbi:TetR/AcrR family transcriptional regulator [Gordonia hydrophobica]|uniref:TetR/AcrR family transcriptional regulator n=2 Tax=Gordonia hydrophobica TaxID=40516 RepID=A0ABZ2U7V8_9ACTN|nr:TetR/AcrR family transcriptional regulator [Gordonia hydrophobica]
MFDREGLSATTNRIAARAGYSVGSLYQYFADKTALLEALATRHVDEAAGAVRAILVEARTDPPSLDQLMASLVDAIIASHDDRRGLHAIMHRTASRTGAAARRVERFEAETVPEIAFHLVRAGRGAPDPALAASAIVTGIDGYLHRVFLVTGDRAEFHRVVGGLVDLHAPASSRTSETTESS